METLREDPRRMQVFHDATGGPLNVLHVAQPLDAGVPRIVADLVRDQVARGWRVQLACPRASVVNELVRDLRVTSHPWEATRSPGVRVPLEVARLRRIVAAVAPDLVHLHSAKAGLAGRIALRGRRPTVFEPNAWSFEALEGIARSVAVRWERVAARWTDALICVSRSERATGVEAGIVAPFEVVPNGVDLEVWSPRREGDRAAARARLDLSGDLALCVCVGRLSRQKGQDVLLDAWPRVKDRVANAHLALIGDGPERAQLEAREVAAVSFVGTRNDVRDWFLAADVVAIPSRWEGMSIGMLEAMATGCSIVSTDVAGASEALGGGAGEVVPIEDSEAVARSLIERLSDADRAHAEGALARSRVEVDHDVRRTNDRIAAVYASVLERRRPSTD